MEPKVSREFFILSLNPKSGYYHNFGNEFGYGLIGSVLMDLYRSGKISIRNKKLVVLDPTPTNYLLFDHILTIIAQKEEIAITRLLYKLGFKGQFTKRNLVKILIDNQDIVCVRKSFLGIPYKRYYTKSGEFKLSLIRRMRDILLRNEKPTMEEMYILPLIYLGRLFKALSDQREERKIMRKRLKVILKNEAYYGNNYNEMRLLQQSIRKVITASNSAPHAG